MSIENRTVVITGAAGNLGRAVAAHFAGSGARLVLVDRQVESLRASFEVGDARHELVGVDLSSSEQVQSALAPAVARLGSGSVLCHLAGAFRMGDAVHQMSDETWNLLFDVNARTLVNVARVIVPHMIASGSGRIVTVGAVAAQRGAARMGAYAAAKASVIRLTESMSAELKEHGINVNCVLPTIIDTPENRSAMPDEDPNRWVSTEALADVIGFLASEASRAIHGAAIPVTGLC